MNQKKTLKQFLFESGVIKKSQEEILLAKKNFRRQYKREFQREHRRKAKRVEITLDNNEAQKWEKLAKENKMKLATIIMKSAEAYISQQYLLFDRTVLDNYLHQLSGVCNNLNQIAKKVNTFGGEVFNEAELKCRITEVENILYKMFTEPKIATQFNNSINKFNNDNCGHQVS